ncbi:ribonuclease H-like domain-containing protein [Tanacetum coccineum]|uniref:Ribonuclease H-like domain-containing protein n=1 Tax=Tanacetum coccineum TaxID=301880 RepID=A0ABQ5DGR9_9ASTR
MEAGTTSATLTTKLPILNLGDYNLWLMRIEQYFLMTDYSLWEVIKNGNKVLKRTIGETEQEYEPTTAEEKQDRRNEMKARGTLLMALLNKDQLKFHSYKDAKLFMEAIEKRYGGNKESKNVQRTLLKQQFENLTGSSSETMDQTFDRLQKLITQLEIQGKVITQEDMNLKLLRSLPSKWKTHALIWRNKQEIETISLDDLYNNLKIYEPEISRSLTNNTAYGVSAAHTQSNPITGDNLSDVVMSKVECYNCHKYGYFARECKAPRNQENKGREINRRPMIVETPIENALVAQDRIRGYDWSSSRVQGRWVDDDSGMVSHVALTTQLAAKAQTRTALVSRLLLNKPCRSGHVAATTEEEHTTRRNESVYKEWEDRMERAAITASSLDAEQDSGSGPRCQDTILGGADAQTRFETASKQSNDPPLLRDYTLGSGKDSMKLLELMELCTKLSDLVSKNKREML